MKKKRTLGRGMAELVEGSFSSIVPPPAGPASPEGSAAPRPAVEPLAVEPALAPGPPTSAAPPHPVPLETLVAPVEPAAALDRTFDVVSVSSGKGGTGKSVLTSNLGVLLAGKTRVTILDADLGLANIHILLNLTPRFNASHVISGERTLEEIMLAGPRGVRLIPGGSGIPELASLSDFMFGALLKGMTSLHQSTDLLLIDTPSGIDRQSLLFLLASDHVLVVTTRDVTAMTDAYAVVKTVLTRRPGASVAVVVNQVRSYAEGLETFHRVAHVARKFLGRELGLGGIIPFDEAVETSVAARTPVSLSHPSHPASQAMTSVAARIGEFHERSARAGQPFPARLRVLLAAAAG